MRLLTLILGVTALVPLASNAEEQLTCDQLASLASRLSVMSRIEPPAILEGKFMEYLKEIHRTGYIFFIQEYIFGPIQQGPTGPSSLAVQVKRECEEWDGTI